MTNCWVKTTDLLSESVLSSVLFNPNGPSDPFPLPISDNLVAMFMYVDYKVNIVWINMREIST